MKLHLPKKLIAAILACATAFGYVAGTANAADDATYELTFGASSVPDGGNIVKLNDSYFIRTQMNSGNPPFYVGLTSGDDPNTLPTGASAVKATLDETGNILNFVANADATDKKVYGWITRQDDGSTSNPSANYGTTTYTVKYNGTYSYVNVDISNASGDVNSAHVTMDGNQFDYDKMAHVGGTLTNTTLKVNSGTMAYKSWINNYEVASDAVLTTASTMTNVGTMTFKENSKLVVSSLDGLNDWQSEIDYSASGIKTIEVGKVLYSGNGNVSGLTQVYIGNATSETTKDVTADGLIISASSKAYVIAANDTVTVGGAAQNPGLSDSPFDFFALSDTGTLQIAGNLTFADGQGEKTAAVILSGAQGTGVIDVQCEAGEVSGLNSKFSGSLTISNGGSLKVTGSRALANTDIKVTGTNSILEIAVLHNNSGALSGANVTLGAGALLKKNGNHNWANENQIHVLTLEGDATIENSTRFGLVATGSSTSTTLALGGHTLTKKGGEGFIMVNTTITGTGTIKTEQGGLMIGYSDAAGKTTVSGTGVTIDLGSSEKTGDSIAIENSGSTLKVAGLINGSAASVNNVGTIELHGTGTYNLDATVKGAGKLKVEGAGIHTLSGANTYSGGTDINAGTVKTGNASALGTGAVSVAEGASLELGDDLQVSSLTITEGGSLIFGNGTTLTVTGTLTLTSANDIKLAEGITFSSADEVTLATGTLALGEGFDATTWAGAGIYTIEGVKYTSSLKAEDDEISLTFKQMVEAPGEPISVTGWDLDGTALTLNVNAALSEGMEVSVHLLNDTMMKDILGKLGEGNYTDGKPMVTITLQGTSGTITANELNEVVFVKGDTGQNYWGEMVDGVGLMYNVERIPEPTTATLSLLALMGLAARRRRK